jgi:hypothetical protein
VHAEPRVGDSHRVDDGSDAPDRMTRTALARATSYTAWTLFALWLGAAYAVLLSADRRYLWHLALYALCALVAWRPQWVRPRRGGGRPWQQWLVTTAWSAFVALPLALLLRGDLHPVLVLNSVLWVGGCAALAVVWTRALRLRTWSWPTLLVATGLVGLFEPGFVIAKSVATAQWSGVFVLTPVLFATHAALVAPIVAAWRTQPSVRVDADGHRVVSPPTAGLGAVLVAAGTGGIAFLLGSLAWLAAARVAIERVAG